jgi:hypothetical protein
MCLSESGAAADVVPPFDRGVDNRVRATVQMVTRRARTHDACAAEVMHD